MIRPESPMPFAMRHEPAHPLCALCSQPRAAGRFHTVKPDDTEPVWVCQDCENKLTRRVDDEGVPGG